MRLFVAVMGVLPISAIFLAIAAQLLRAHATGEQLLGDDTRLRIQATAREIGLLCSLGAFGWLFRYRRSRWRSNLPPTNPPVVLVGGALFSAVIPRWVQKVLEHRLGDRQILVFSASRQGPVSTQDELHSWLERGMAVSGAKSVDLIGFGAGALAVLGLGHERKLPIRRAMVVAPPLMGSRIGVFLHGPWGEALRSRFETFRKGRKLPTELHLPRALRNQVLCLRGAEDAVYLPDETRGPAWLRSEDLLGVGHLGVMVAPTTIRRVVEELTR